MSLNEVKAAWMDGEVVPSWKANVNDGGIFEEIRCYETARGPAVFRLHEHIDHLFESAGVAGIEIPFKRHELAAAVCQTIEANKLSSCHVRLTVFSDSSTVHAAVIAVACLTPDDSPEIVRDRLHFVDDCTFQGAYSAVPCI